MPKNITVLRVFVASPSDVSDERSLLDTVIAELNRTWSGTLGLMLDVLKWETNVRPAFASDPQAAINAQIPSDYDVLIAIFWGRIGTPTPRAPSGSIEEFEQAYKRFLATGSPQLLIYFKDAPIAPSKMDLEQLQDIQKFRKSLTSKGGLYWTFDDLSSFESSLRSHLSAIAQQFASQAQHMVSTSVSRGTSEPSLTPVTEDPIEDDDYGYLDYIEITENKQSEMTEALRLLNEATVRIGEQMTQRAAELNAEQPTDARSARHFILRTADDMNDYASILKRLISIITAARVDAYTALSKALAMWSEFKGNTEQLQSLRNTLAGVQEGASNAEVGMRQMRESAQALPRMTRDLNKAKRAVVEQIDALLVEIDSTKLTVGNIVEAIDKMLGEGSDVKH